MPRLEHIGLDVDGVLRDLASQLIAVFEREHPELRGRHLPVDQWPDWWGFERYFPAECDIYALTRRFHRELWVEAGTYPEVDAFYRKLAAGYTVHIVTSQPSRQSAEATRLWLERNRIDVPPERVHITSSKGEAPVQVLVDDMAHNLEAVQQNGIVGVCLTRPWNREWEGPRIDRLEQLFPMLEALEQERARR